MTWLIRVIEKESGNLYSEGEAETGQYILIKPDNWTHKTKTNRKGRVTIKLSPPKG